MLATLLALPLALSPVQRTWLVDADPACSAADFTTIQQAVDAAADGDTIFVRALPGQAGYERFVITDKGLRLIGVPIDGVERVLVEGRSLVLHTGADSAVVLRGLHMRDEFGPESRLEISGCDGPVWIADCVVDSRDLFTFGSVGAIEVSFSDEVAVIGSSVYGFSGLSVFPFLPFDGPGSPAMEVSNGTVAAYDSLFVGGDAGACASSLGPPGVGYAGSPGVALGDLGVFDAYGCQLVGGDGGSGCGGETGTGFDPGTPGVGGDALAMASMSSSAELYAASFQGGAGSLPGAGGPAGAGSANADVLLGTARTLRTVEPIVAEGGLVQLGYDGGDGDTVLLAFQFEQQHGELAGIVGRPLIAVTGPVLPLGIADPNGAVSLAVPVPAGLVPPGTSIGVGAQALGISTQGEAVLTSATWVELVDLVTGVGDC